MNRIVTKFDKTAISNAMSDDRSDRCEHVEADTGSAHAVWSELDSFGPVFVLVVCQGCHDDRVDDEENELVCCVDCKQRKPRRDTFEWRWYDFYAEQGDDPLVVCKDCGGGEEHKARVARDKEDARREDERREQRMQRLNRW